MGVEVRVVGQRVELRGYGKVAGRDALTWADEVRRAAESSLTRVLVLCEFEREMSISTADFAAACRASISLQPLIAALAMVTPNGFERVLARAAIAVTNPPFEVRFFDDAWHARTWLDTVRCESTAA
jgi:hypothetical protein